MITLRQGDCLELMKDIPDGSVDMVLADPPYGIDFQSRRPQDKQNIKPKILNDTKPFVDFIPMLKRIVSSSGCIMIFTRWDVQGVFIEELARNHMRTKNVIIWDKVAHGMGDLKRAYASRYESIIFCSMPNFKFNGKRPQDIIRVPRVPASKLSHPNEKPTALLETLICQCTDVGATVLDPFMGSGSTGVTCINTGRNFIGIELDDKYFRIAESRCAL